MLTVLQTFKKIKFHKETISIKKLVTWVSHKNIKTLVWNNESAKWNTKIWTNKVSLFQKNFIFSTRVSSLAEKLFANGSRILRTVSDHLVTFNESKDRLAKRFLILALSHTKSSDKSRCYLISLLFSIWGERPLYAVRIVETFCSYTV